METKREPQVGDVVITKGYSDLYDGIPVTISKINQGKYCYFNNTGENFRSDMIVEYRDDLKEVQYGRKIIGYKLKKDCNQYEPVIEALLCRKFTSCKNWWETWSKKHIEQNGYHVPNTSSNLSSVKDILQTNGLLDLWFEPIYETITLSFGGHEVSFNVEFNEVYITCNDHTGTLTELSKMISTLQTPSPRFAGYSIDPEFWIIPKEDSPIKIGCVKGTFGEMIAIRNHALNLIT